MLAARLSRVATLTLRSSRAYSENPGAVAQSTGFSKKEKAHEDQYVREKERQELKKLKEKLEEMQRTVKKLDKEAGEAAEQAKKE